MKNVLLRGPLLTKSGYGVHSRQVFRYLKSKTGISLTTEITPWGITPWDVDTSKEDISQILECSNSTKDKKFDVSFQVQLPNEWDASLAEYNIGVTAAVETDKCNPLWTSLHVPKMDKVIVPSEFTKEILGSDFEPALQKIQVINEAFFDEILNDSDDSVDLNLNLKTDFNFLTIGVLTGSRPETDRKNLFYLIKWFVEEFKDDSDVGLIIKTNMGRDSVIDRYNTKSLLKKVISELNHNGKPKIYLLHGSMDRSEMVSLYRSDKVKAFVSLTRGEGFGLPHLESAACGLPVIATDWSAHTEFLNLGDWVKVDYQLKNVHESKIDNQIFMTGAKWAAPSEKDAKIKLRHFKNNEKLAKKSAVELSTIIQQKYCWDQIYKTYDKHFSEVLS